MNPPQIEADAHARAFIADNGGNVYVWCDASGLEYTTLTPPDNPPRWTTIRGDGFTLHVDTTIGTPYQSQFVFHHLPHRHVTAIYNGDIGSLSAAGFPYFPPA